MTRWLIVVVGLSVWMVGCGSTDKCGPNNCNGCCDSAGACQGGASLNACGSQGASCDFCASTQSCHQGACTTAVLVTPDAGTGTDGGSPDAGLPPPRGDAGVPDSGTPPAGGPGALWFSGDWVVDGTDQLGTMSGTSFEVVDQGLAAGARFFEISPDGTQLLMGLPATFAVGAELWVASLSGGGLVDPVKLVSIPTFGTIEAAHFSPDGTLVAFHGDLDTNELRDVYVVPVAGGTRTKVSPARPVGGTPGSLQPTAYSWSRDSQTLAIAGDYEANNVFQLYLASPSGGTPVTALSRTAAGTATSGVNSSDFALGWTGAGKLLFKAKLAGDQGYHLYSIGADGTGLALLPNSPEGTPQVGSFGLSPDGNTLAFSADTLTPTAYEVYRMPADGSAAPVRLTSGTVAAGTKPSFFGTFRWSPDSLQLAFVADYGLHNKFEPYVVSASGGGQQRLAAIGASSDVQDALDVAWNPDSSALAFIADHRQDEAFELWRVADVGSADQTPVLVQGVPSGGDITSLQWVP